MNNAKPNIIFIASASRSGSTLLDQILGHAEGACSVGELRRLNDFANLNFEFIRDPANQKGCTCGKKISECPFWSEVEAHSGLALATDHFSSQLGALDRALFKAVFFFMGSSITKWISSFYKPFQVEITVGENCFKIYEAIARLTGSRLIVDSSKQIHQFIILKVARPNQVKLLALIRDGRAVAKSVIRAERLNHFGNGKYAAHPHQAFKAAIRYWVNSNLQILGFYLRTPKHERLWVNYEKFCGEPNEFRERILRQFSSDHSSPIHRLSSRTSHNIGGSPSRFSFSLDKIALDARWREDWKELDRKTFAFYGGLMNKILGYRD